jgi:hypothetical protein
LAFEIEATVEAERQASDFVEERQQHHEHDHRGGGVP